MGKNFKCTVCHKKYLQLKYFNEHIKNVHSDPIIPCGTGDCRALFKVEKDRKQHIKRRHGGTRKCFKLKTIAFNVPYDDLIKQRYSFLGNLVCDSNNYWYQFYLQ